MTNPTMGRIRALRLLGALAIAGTASAAIAQSDVTVSADKQMRQVAVRYGDLNLANAHGMATLDRRLDVAANEACQADAQYTIGAHADVVRCRTAAIANAHSAIQRRTAMADGNTVTLGTD